MKFLARLAPSLIPGLGAFLNPWVLLIVLATAIGLYAYGRHDGTKITEAGWQAREAGINAKTAERIAELNRQARERERKHAQDLALISGQYQDKLRSLEREKDRVIADVRTGLLRLSIPARCSSPGSGTGETAPGTGGRDASGRAELSPEAAEFLVGEASRADKIVEKLTACQAIVRRDRQP